MPNSTARFGRLIPNSTAPRPRSVMTDPSSGQSAITSQPAQWSAGRAPGNDRSNSTVTRYSRMPRSDTTSRAANMRSVRSVCVEYTTR